MFLKNKNEIQVFNDQRHYQMRMMIVMMMMMMMMTMPLMGVDRRSSGPFRKQLLPFLRHKIFDLLLRVFLSKRKKIAIQGRTQTSNSDLSYPHLSPLPLHYHIDPENSDNLST